MSDTTNARWDEESIRDAIFTLARHNDSPSLGEPFQIDDIVGVGDLYRAWHALEAPWLGRITTDELLEVLPADLFDDEVDQHHTVSRLFATCASFTHTDWISELLSILVSRQCIYQVAPRAVAVPNQMNARSARHDQAECALTIRSLLRHASSLFEDADVAQKVLALPQGTVEHCANFFGDAVSWEFLREVASSAVPLTPDIERIVDAFQSTPIELDRLLEDAARLFPFNPHVAHAFGTHLALTGRHELASYQLMKAYEAWPGDVAVTYMLMDCAASLQSKPPLNVSMADFVCVPEDELFVEFPPLEPLDDPYLGDVGEIERLLIMRGIRVELGLECPYTTPTATWDSSPHHRTPHTESIQIDLERIEAKVDRNFVATEQHRTETAAGTNRLERAIDSSEFWIDQLVSLLPQDRRNEMEASLSAAVPDWDKLPPLSRSELIAARYVMDDAALAEGARARASIRAIAHALEVAARKHLLVGQGADLGDVIRYLDEHDLGTPALRSALRKLRVLRNDAAHKSGQLVSTDAHEAWEIVVGSESGRTASLLSAVYGLPSGS